GHALAASDRHDDQRRARDLLHRDGPVVVVPAWFCSRLRFRLARAFPRRKEPARDFQISALVVNRRLQNDRPDADGPNGMVQIVRANIPIPEIPHGEDLWLILLVTSVRRRRTQQGRLYYDVSARNATGSIFLRLWGDVAENQGEMKPGLWAVKGKLETFQERAQFVVAEYRSTTIEKYREH